MSYSVRIRMMAKEALYITRKHKKWKYWHFDQFRNCFHLADAKPKELSRFLDGAEKVVLEIGAGTANLGLEIARRNPNTRVIAVDVKSDRLYTGAKAALQQKIENIYFLRGHVQMLREVLKEASVDTIWVTFPDPFGKDKQEKHRLTGEKFLNLYRFLLKPGGALKFKTDDKKLFEWSVIELERLDWKIEEITRDLHNDDNFLEDCEERILTDYEIKFKNQGKVIGYLKAKINEDIGPT